MRKTTSRVNDHYGKVYRPLTLATHPLIDFAIPWQWTCQRSEKFWDDSFREIKQKMRRVLEFMDMTESQENISFLTIIPDRSFVIISMIATGWHYINIFVNIFFHLDVFICYLLLSVSSPKVVWKAKRLYRVKQVYHLH